LEKRHIMLNECILFGLEPRAAEHPYGFRLTHGGKIKEFFCDDKSEYDSWYAKLKRYCIQTNFEEEYQLIKRLGAGNFSAVYEGKSNKTEQSFAIKVIEKWEILESAKHLVK
jgi:serine/threonine protein kinase